MNTKSLAVLSTLRRIIQTVDQHEKELSRHSGLTLPQLLILQRLQASQPMTTGALARQMNLAQATVTSILDRLELKHLIERTRNSNDKRKVWIQMTKEGAERLHAAPSTLQTRLINQYEQMADWEQTLLLSTLERIAGILAEPDPASNTAPMLDSGDLTRSGEH